MNQKSEEICLQTLNVFVKSCDGSVQRALKQIEKRRLLRALSQIKTGSWNSLCRELPDIRHQLKWITELTPDNTNLENLKEDLERIYPIRERLKVIFEESKMTIPDYFSNPGETSSG